MFRDKIYASGLLYFLQDLQVSRHEHRMTITPVLKHGLAPGVASAAMAASAVGSAEGAAPSEATTEAAGAADTADDEEGAALALVLAAERQRRVAKAQPPQQVCTFDWHGHNVQD